MTTKLGLVTDIRLLAIDILDLLRAEGGCTLNLDTGEKAKTGYAVSLPGGEAVFHNRLPTSQEIRTWLRNEANPLAAIAEHHGGYAVHAGAWADPATGHTYLDVSVVITDRAKAIEAGQEWKQLAIRHLDTGEDIYLGVRAGSTYVAHSQPAIRKAA